MAALTRLHKVHATSAPPTMKHAAARAMTARQQGVTADRQAAISARPIKVTMPAGHLRVASVMTAKSNDNALPLNTMSAARVNAKTAATTAAQQATARQPPWPHPPPLPVKTTAASASPRS